jgi:hypothetical protein
LIQHARANHIAGVTHSERECTVHSRQRPDLKRHVLTDVIDDPYVARGILWIDPLPHDAAGIVDAECCDKVTSIRRRLRDDCRAATAINHPALQTSAVDRADRNR